MNKYLLYLIAFMVISSPAVCADMPADVPEGHYAYDSIQALVDRGINVSQGYPDGTFRGSRRTSRYETAYLMAKLALSLKESGTASIDASDLKEELSYLRGELDIVKKMPQVQSDFQFYGSAQILSRFGSVIAYEQDNRAKLGPETNYRLQYTMQKDIGADASFRMNLDTMDGGFNTTSVRNFGTKLLDFEGDITTDMGIEYPVRIKALIGPGTVLHRDTTGTMPSEDYTYFARPRPTFQLSTRMGSYEVSTAYLGRSVASSGAVGTHEVNFEIAQKVGELPLLGTSEIRSTTRYAFTEFMSPSMGPDDMREELSLTSRWAENISQKILLACSGAEHFGGNFYLNYELRLNNNGSKWNFLVNSVGDGYRDPFEELEFVPLNSFNRKILDGTVDIALELEQPITGDLRLKCNTDWVGTTFMKMGRDLPGTSFTTQLSLDYSMWEDLIITTYYRYYYVPSKVAQFGVAVPEYSDVLGLGVKYDF